MATDVSSLISKIPVSERSAFKSKVEAIAGRLKVTFNELMVVMDFESAGSFDPAIKNSLGYVGLIQFGTAAAKDLGTTTDALRAMTRLQQLDYVERYFNLWKGRLGISKFNSFVDLYLAVFYPAGIKETDPNKPITGPKVALANPGLRDSKGFITKNSIKAAYAKRYSGLLEVAVEYVKKNPKYVAIGLIVLGLAVFALYYELYKNKSVVKLAGL